MKPIKLTPLDIFSSITFSFLLADLSRRFFEYPRGLWITVGIFLSLLFICVLNSSTKESTHKKYKFSYSIIPLLLLYFCFWYEKLFGTFDIGALLFHIEMGVENTATDGVFYKVAARYFSLFALLNISLIYLISRFRVIELMDKLVAIPILLSTPLAAYLLGSIYYSEYTAVMAPLFHDVSANLKLKQPPKNIIMIYAESGERTYQYLENGTNIYAPMIAVANRGLEAVNVEQVTNTGWTVAGLIASQCGTSLQPLGLMRHNNFQQRKDFLPGIVCLSDILSEQGYINEFFNGADLAFAGMNNFLDQHNYERSSGLHAYHNEVGDYMNSWGLYDDTLLEAAVTKVQALNQQEKPFLFTVMTIGGHSPMGHVTQKCKDELKPASSKEILFAVQCMGHHIKEFIDTLENDGLLENTIVVIMSDHLVMTTEVSEQLDKFERRNFLTLINDDIQIGIKEKKMATFDIFPTVLEALGFDLPEHKAGLGISMFADEPSLVEQYGKEKLNKMLEFDKSLARKIWFSNSVIQ